MIQRILILAYNAYNFEDKESKEKKEGLTIHYVGSSKEGSNDKNGYFPAKESVDLGLLSSMQGTGYYEQTLGCKVKGGKMVLYTEDLKFIEPFTFKKGA